MLSAVRTPRGKLLGEDTGSSAQQVRVFRGVPYAVPPVGVRRWKHAEPHPGWQGERLAIGFGPECPQPPGSADNFYYRPQGHASEDCLYLNVWTPAQRGEALPVMVFIHGGGLTEGSGASPAYDGTGLARKGVIVVTLNYRLGVFGFFAHPELHEEEGSVPGNYGLTDQILALQWIRENISAFGGDPERVTIFGQSAGALSVLSLLVSPLSAGLFHGAIAQSPYLKPLPRLREPSLGKVSAESQGTSLAASLGASSLTVLREMPAHRLLEGAIDAGFYNSSADPVVDDWLLPEQVFELLEQGNVHDVPVIVGLTSGEVDHLGVTPGWPAPIPASPKEYREKVRARYGPLAEEYLEIYPPDDLKDAALAPIRDGLYGWAAEKLAQAVSAGSSSAYFYYFDHAPAWAERYGIGAFHGSEISYAFDNVTGDHRYSTHWPQEPARDVDHAMAAVMSAYWTAFARTGAPAVDGRPEWRSYDLQERHHQYFADGKARSGRALHPGTWELHEAILAERRAIAQPWAIDLLGLAAPPLTKGRS